MWHGKDPLVKLDEATKRETFAISMHKLDLEMFDNVEVLLRERLEAALEKYTDSD